MSPFEPHVFNSNSMSKRHKDQANPGNTTTMKFQRSEFEDFMNAYRPTLEVPRRDVDSKATSRMGETRTDFGKSFKNLMKRTQTSPNIQVRNRKEGTQKISNDDKNDIKTPSVLQEKKARRPASTCTDSNVVKISSLQTLSSSSSYELTNTVINVEIPPSPTKNEMYTKTNIFQSVNSDEISLPHSAPIFSPTQTTNKKKISLQDPLEKRDCQMLSANGNNDFCLVFPKSCIYRLLPPNDTPDAIHHLKVVEAPESKYHAILEFEESPVMKTAKASPGGLLMVTSETNDANELRERRNAFMWIKESKIASEGILLMNIEKESLFPFIIYLKIKNDRKDSSQTVINMRNRPRIANIGQFYFVTGYKEIATVCHPDSSNILDHQFCNNSGFVICLYQVLEGDDREKFEKNWVMWTGARMLYNRLPRYFGLNKMSLHKKVCVLVDQLRARCCGFAGVYTALETL